MSKILKGFWYVFLILPMVTNLWDKKQMSQNWEVFSKISMSIVFQNLLVICVVVALCATLLKISPFLSWSWFSLLTSKNNETNEETPYEAENINLSPAKVKYLGLIFLVILAANIPRYAHFEEVMFREGTTSWQHGLLMSLLFGMVHCIVGVPLAAGLTISIVGVWLTHQYFMGGVELSTLHHTTYNLILVSIIFVMYFTKHTTDLFNKKKEMV